MCVKELISLVCSAYRSMTTLSATGCYYLLWNLCCSLLPLQAYTRNMYHPRYTWIVYGWYSNDWWNRARVSCNATEMSIVTDRAIILQQYPILLDAEVTMPRHVTHQMGMLPILGSKNAEKMCFTGNVVLLLHMGLHLPKAKICTVCSIVEQGQV